MDFPMTEEAAVFRPQAIARVMTKSTLGPGAMMITIEAARYCQIRVGMITARSYLLALKNGKGQDLSHSWCVEVLTYVVAS
jgi:hypothetical protein